jgi:hypothetical protein
MTLKVVDVRVPGNPDTYPGDPVPPPDRMERFGILFGRSVNTYAGAPPQSTRCSTVPFGTQIQPSRAAASRSASGIGWQRPRA